MPRPIVWAEKRRQRGSLGHVGERHGVPVCQLIRLVSQELMTAIDHAGRGERGHPTCGKCRIRDHAGRSGSAVWAVVPIAWIAMAVGLALFAIMLEFLGPGVPQLWADKTVYWSFKVPTALETWHIVGYGRSNGGQFMPEDIRSWAAQISS